MALRSVLRKMPALSLRSPPMGPLMGPLRALSPAAASRLISSGGQAIHSEGTLAEQLESINLRCAGLGRKLSGLLAESDRKWAELHRKWAEHERRTAAEFDKTMEMHRQEIASGEAHYNEVMRRNNEDLSRFMKELHIAVKTCTVLNVVFLAGAILVTINVNM